MMKKCSHLFIIGALAVHSFLLNGYSFGYGFNYIPFGYNLPPIFVRNDPSLYPLDIYVQSSIHYNTFFFDLISWAVRYIEIEKVAICLCIVSLYFMLLAIFYLTTTLFKNRTIAYCAILLYGFGLRQWTLGEPGIYINFLDAGIVAYPLLIFALVFFLKRHFFVSFFLVGLTFNIHLPYALNLLFLFLSFFAYRYKLLNLKFVSLSALSLLIPAAPLFSILPSLLSKMSVGDEWFQAIRAGEWFHHLPSQWDLKQFIVFAIFLIFFLIALRKAPKDDKRSTVIILLSAMAILCVMSAVFVELIPTSFFIKLHVWNYGTWIFYFIALSYLANFLISSWDDNLLKQFAIIGMVPLIAGYLQPYWLLPFFLAIVLAFNYQDRLKTMSKVSVVSVSLLLAYFLFANLIPQLRHPLIHIRQFCFFFMLSLLIFLFFNKFMRELLSLHRGKQIFLFTGIILLIFFDLGFLYKQGGCKINYRGYSETRINPWVDIQLYARDHTPKDALFIVPPYLEGFTVFSLRSVLGDWIIGTTCVWGDNDYAKEWLKRMELLGWNCSRIFKGWTEIKEGYNALTTREMLRVAKEYNASYVVSEKIKRLNLPVVYENEQFILYLAKDGKSGQGKDLKRYLYYITNQKDGAKMVWIPEGEFIMGSEKGEEDEKPVHKVFSNGFYMDVSEITNSKYCMFLNEMGKNEERVKRWIALDSKNGLIEKRGDWFVVKSGFENYPVAGVSWYGAHVYAKWAGKRIPTEAEWEYAVRGGLNEKLYAWGDADPFDGTLANYNCSDDGYKRLSPAGAFSANGYGLYDMAGNVWEWCSDWYNSNFYEWSSYRNPWSIMPEGTFRVRRGGSWKSDSNSLRNSYRSFSKPAFKGMDMGFRCCK